MKLIWCAAAVAVLGLGACDQQVQKDHKDSTIAAKFGGYPPPPVAEAPECKAGAMSLAFNGETEKGDDRVASFAFVNTSKAACSLSGFPSVAVAEAGSPYSLPLFTKHDQSVAKNVVVPVGGKAGFTLTYAATAKPKGPCKKASGIAAAFPGESDYGFKASGAMQVCGDTIKISPIKAA